MRLLVVIVAALFSLSVLAVEERVPQKQSTKLRERHPNACTTIIEDVTNLPWNFWTEELVKKSIRALYPHRGTIGLLGKQMQNDNTLSTATLLKEICGRIVTGGSLFRGARQIFATWEDAVNASLKPMGVTYEDLLIYYGVRMWNDDLLLGAIKWLYDHGIPLNAASIAHDGSLKTSMTLFAFRGRWTTGRAIHASSVRRWGSWDEALGRAGILPSEVRRYSQWKEEAIVSIIQSMNTKEWALNIFSVIENNSKALQTLIARYTGSPSSGNALVQAAVRRFGSWDLALIAAGLVPNEIRKYRGKGHDVRPRYQSEYLRREDRPQNIVGRLGLTPPEILEEVRIEERIDDFVHSLPESEQLLAGQVAEIILSSEDTMAPSQIARTLRREYQYPNLRMEKVQHTLSLFQNLVF